MGEYEDCVWDQQKARVELDGCFDSCCESQTCSINLRVYQSCKRSHRFEERESVAFSSPNTVSFFIGYFYSCRPPGVNLPAGKTLTKTFEIFLIPKQTRELHNTSCLTPLSPLSIYKCFILLDSIFPWLTFSVTCPEKHVFPVSYLWSLVFLLGIDKTARRF